MELIRATKENGLFSELEAQWKGQLAEYEETLDQYIPAYRDHCHTIIEGAPADYYIYLMNDNGAYNGFVHINHARHGIKRLPPPTIRVLEIYLAPDYDYKDITDDKMSDICAGLFTELLRLSEEQLEANSVKIHMGPLDKSYLIAMSKLSSKSMGLTVSSHGSWLVIEKNATQKKT